MNVNELKTLLFTHKKSMIKSEFELKKANEIINALESVADLELENIALFVIKKGFFGLSELCEGIDSEFLCLAQKRALEFDIKDFKGTEYEKQNFKRAFCYSKLVSLMPQSFKSLRD